MRLERLTPGRRPPAGAVGAVLARDLIVAGARWSKGRRLSAADLAAFNASPPAGVDEVTVIVLEPGDLHEDDAAVRLAAAVAGPGLAIRGPVQSRVDLVAEHDGVLHVRSIDLERINRLDPLEVFTRLDGSIVSGGDLVASVKVAPHVVAASVVEAGVRIATKGRDPLVRVAPFRPMRVAVVVKESLRASDRPRFERSVRDKVESLGSTVTGIAYVATDGNSQLISNVSFSKIGQSQLPGRIPVSTAIMVGVFLLGFFLLRATRFGTHVFAVGGGEDAARLSGVRVRDVKIRLYVLSAISAGLAGVVQASAGGSVAPYAASSSNDLLTILAAVIIGGTALTGGRGTIVGTLVGILLLGTIANGLVLKNISSFYQPVVTGAILLIAIVLDETRRRLQPTR